MLSLLAYPAFGAGQKSFNVLFMLDPGDDRHDGKRHGNPVIPRKPLYNRNDESCNQAESDE